jgi:hypothetical protein
MKLTTAVALLVLVSMLAGSAAAQVLVFDKYDTVSTVEGDTIRIERQMTLTNVARNPVIPGELHFKLYQEQGGDRTPIPVLNFVATNDRGQTLSTKIVNRDDQTNLAVTVWDPLLPGFSYHFKVSYEMEFEPSGILFYELRIPREDTTIPIQESAQTVLLDGGYHITYAPDTTVSKLSGNTVVKWDGQQDGQVIEYSSLPFPQVKIGSFALRAVNLFWGVVIICLLGLFGFSIRRQQRIREEAELAELEREHHLHQERTAMHKSQQPPGGQNGG